MTFPPIPFLRPRLDVRLMAESVSLSAGAWSARRAFPPTSTPAASAATPPWRAAVGALAELLGAGSNGARRARIVLSDRFVRYCVIPAAAGVTRGDEQAAWARHAFRADYGAAVEGWRVSVDTDAAGAGVAALIDNELFVALDDTCAAAGLRLDSLAPHFAATQAQLAARVRERDAWFAVLEAGHLAAALRLGGSWRHVLAARLDDNGTVVDVRAIQAALEARSLGLPEAGAVRTLHVAAPARAGAAREVGGGWVLHRWLDPCAAPA